MSRLPADWRGVAWPFQPEESAADLFSRVQRRTVHTGFDDIDTFLGGGIDPGHVLELWGPSGCGKTEMLTQVVARSLMPRHLGGEERNVVVVDVDGKFSLQRVSEIIRHLAARVEIQLDMGELLRECFKHMQIITCVDRTQIIFAILSLAECRFTERAGTWLLALDSISAFHWLERHDRDVGFKAQLATGLSYLFTQQRVACVVTKALLYAVPYGQTPREYMGSRWNADVKKHRMRLSEETRRGEVLRTATVTKHGSVSTNEDGLKLTYSLAKSGPQFSVLQTQSIQ